MFWVPASEPRRDIIALHRLSTSSIFALSSGENSSLPLPFSIGAPRRTGLSSFHRPLKPLPEFTSAVGPGENPPPLNFLK
jgi:hypothetical protein